MRERCLEPLQLCSSDARMSFTLRPGWPGPWGPCRSTSGRRSWDARVKRMIASRTWLRPPFAILKWPRARCVSRTAT
eukprot:7079496-Alexandrium_andersonii.AAC.1